MGRRWQCATLFVATASAEVCRVVDQKCDVDFSLFATADTDPMSRAMIPTVASMLGSAFRCQLHFDESACLGTDGCEWDNMVCVGGPQSASNHVQNLMSLVFDQADSSVTDPYEGCIKSLGVDHPVRNLVEAFNRCSKVDFASCPSGGWTMQGPPGPGAFDSNQTCSQFVYEVLDPDDDDREVEVCLPNIPALLHAITTAEEFQTITTACPAPSSSGSVYFRRLHGVAANIVHEPFLRLLGLASTIAQSGGGGAPPVVNDAFLLGALQNALPPPFDCYLQQLIPMNKVAPYYPAMQCLLIQEEQSCTANSDCSWGAPLMPGRCSPKIASVVGDECALHGAAVCLDQNEASCGSQSQCAWTRLAGSCEEPGYPPPSCGGWDEVGSEGAHCATQSGCEWDGDYCNPIVCNSQTDEATCGAQSHCTWRLGNPFCNVKLASLVEMIAGDFSSGGELSLMAAGSFAAMQCQNTPTAECSSVSYDTLPASAAALLQSLPADENSGADSSENNDTDSSDSSNNNMGMIVGGGLVAVLVVGGVVFLSGVCAQEKHDETHGMEMGSRA